MRQPDRKSCQNPGHLSYLNFMLFVLNSQSRTGLFRQSYQSDLVQVQVCHFANQLFYTSHCFAYPVKYLISLHNTFLINQTISINLYFIQQTPTHKQRLTLGTALQFLFLSTLRFEIILLSLVDTILRNEFRTIKDMTWKHYRSRLQGQCAVS